MYDTGTEPKPLLPAFGSLYQLLVPLAWLLIRCAAGAMLLVHGYAKVGHIDGVVETMVRIGLAPPLFWAWVVSLIETVGAICVALGLFTRFFAAACAIELGIIAFRVFMPRGYGAMEFTLLWGLVMLAIAFAAAGLIRLIGSSGASFEGVQGWSCRPRFPPRVHARHGNPRQSRQAPSARRRHSSAASTDMSARLPTCISFGPAPILTRL